VRAPERPRSPSLSIRPSLLAFHTPLHLPRVGLACPCVADLWVLLRAGQLADARARLPTRERRRAGSRRRAGGAKAAFARRRLRRLVPSASRRRWLIAEGLTPLLCVAGTHRSTTRRARAAGGSTAHESIGSGVDSIGESVDESAASATSAATECAWRRRACGGDVWRRRRRSASMRASGARSSASASPVLGAVYVMYVPTLYVHVSEPRRRSMPGRRLASAQTRCSAGFVCMYARSMNLLNLRRAHTHSQTLSAPTMQGTACHAVSCRPTLKHALRSVRSSTAARPASNNAQTMAHCGREQQPRARHAGSTAHEHEAIASLSAYFLSRGCV